MDQTTRSPSNPVGRPAPDRRPLPFASRPGKPAPPALRPWAYAGVAGAIVALAVGLLWALGREPVCPCGAVLLWYGRPGGPGNSQHLADWYSLLHLVHGIVTWPVFWLTSRHWPAGWLVLMGLVTGAGWEVIENTPAVIDAFGPAPSGATYSGDSIVNSLSDVLFATLGFAFAMRVGWRTALAAALALEVAVGLAIRDGILLGLMGMVAPVPAVIEWQQGAALAQT